jgi:molybdopterin synthase sulfur carrier subunit
MTKLKLFASLREAVGISEIDIDGMEGQSLASVKQSLIDQGEPWSALDGQEIIFAVNHAICAPDTLVKQGDELAMFPPVTGG